MQGAGPGLAVVTGIYKHAQGTSQRITLTGQAAWLREVHCAVEVMNSSEVTSFGGGDLRDGVPVGLRWRRRGQMRPSTQRSGLTRQWLHQELGWPSPSISRYHRPAL